jgi:hypothetical protein
LAIFISEARRLGGRKIFYLLIMSACSEPQILASEKTDDVEMQDGTHRNSYRNDIVLIKHS